MGNARGGTETPGQWLWRVALASGLLMLGVSALIPLAKGRPAAYAGMAAFGSLLFVCGSMPRRPVSACRRPIRNNHLSCVRRRRAMGRQRRLGTAPSGLTTDD